MPGPPARRLYALDLLVTLLASASVAYAGLHAYFEVCVRGAALGGGVRNGVTADLLVFTLGCLCFAGALVLVRAEVSARWTRRATSDAPMEGSVLGGYIGRRLSRRRLFPLLAAVLVICAYVTWSGVGNSAARDLVLEMQWVALFVLGTTTVALAASRVTGTYLPGLGDVSPQPSAALTLALLAGAPAREYVLFASMLPFSLAASLRAGWSPSAWLGFAADMLVLSVLCSALAALFGLALRHRAASVTVVLLLVILLHVGWQIQPIGCLTLAPLYEVLTVPQWSVPPPPHTTLLGTPASALLVSLLHQAPLLLFLVVTVARKTRVAGTAAVSKLGAVALYVVVAVLLLLDAPVGIRSSPPGSLPSVDLGLLTLGYGLLATGALLVSLVTVDAATFRQGLRRVLAWDERAANFVPTLCIGACCAGAGLVAAALAPGIAGYRHAVVTSTLVGAGAILFWGSTKQAFALAFPRRGAIWFALLVGACWGLPLVIGCASFLLANVEPADSVAFALSPLSSIGLLLLAGPTAVDTAPSVVALIAGLLLTLGGALFAAWITRRAARAAVEAG
ncbi:MAG: hypothetical protein ABSD48_09320 [Armatimonadota bacterium]